MQIDLNPLTKASICLLIVQKSSEINPQICQLLNITLSKYEKIMESHFFK